MFNECVVTFTCTQSVTLAFALIYSETTESFQYIYINLSRANPSLYPDSLFNDADPAMNSAGEQMYNEDTVQLR